MSPANRFYRNFVLLNQEVIFAVKFDIHALFLCRRDFQKEVHIMSQLKDANIVRVLGVSTVDSPWCVIVEYMKFGDLNQFLQTHVPDWTGTKRKGARQLR